jgi:hypothetical protein
MCKQIHLWHIRNQQILCSQVYLKSSTLLGTFKIWRTIIRRCRYGFLLIILRNTNRVVLGGLVVIVLVIGPNFHGFEPGEDDGFLRAIKSVARLPCEILRHVKNRCGVWKSSSAKFTDVSLQVYPCFATRCLCPHLPGTSVGFISND